MALAALFATQGTPGQPQVPAASIEGSLIKMGSGEPVAGAKVTLKVEKVSVLGDPLPLDTRTATTDQDGKFVLPDVPPGSYRLIATRAGGYIPAEYGQRSATGQGIPLEVSSGQQLTGIQLVMMPTASISGRIYDRDGEPLGRAQVQALRSVYRNGHRRMTIVQSVESNDRGEYRLFWLAPGSYYISARPDIPTRPEGPLLNSTSTSAVRITDPARFGAFEQASMPVVLKRTLRSGETVEETHLAVYYPGVPEAQAASPITVAAGAATDGVDISVGPGIVPVHHIRGRAINGADGQALARATIMAIPRTMEPDLRVPIGQADSNGFFDISGALPGSYLLFASNGRISGTLPIEAANEDVQNVAVVAGPGFKLSGRFTIEGHSRSGLDPKIADLRVGRFTRDIDILGNAGPSFNPPPSEDGSFILDGVSAGDLRVTIRGVPLDAYVKSIRMGNADVLDDGLHITGPPDNPLEIVIGANAGTLHGSAMNARQEPAANRAIVLVPDLRLRHRSDLYKSVFTDGSGRFRITGVTPGDYKLFAFDEVEAGIWEDPDFIRNYEDRGKPVHVNDGSDEDIPLTVNP